MAHQLCPALGFANVHAQAVCGNAVVQGAQDAAAVVAAEHAPVVAKALKAAGGGFTPADGARMMRVEAMLRNLPARLSNAATRLLSHEMQKLQREEDGPGIGQEPGLGVTFPTTRGGIELLTNQQLDDLEAFYGVNFGGQSVSARQVKFARFIGA